ncbi:ferric reductase-like transmembrane domain-containing protein [Neobacillus sp. Marseille-QA0830]
MSNYFSTWTLIRTSGILAYYLLTLSLCLGLLANLTLMKKKKGTLVALHQSSGWYGLLVIVFHMILLSQDRYVPYSIAELIIPFSAQNETVFSALGTFSFYLFILVIGSSDFFIKKLGIKKWKKLHLAVLPAWSMAVIHGMAIGTDTSEPWALLLYSTGILILIALGCIRSIDAQLQKRTTTLQKTEKSRAYVAEFTKPKVDDR